MTAKPSVGTTLAVDIGGTFTDLTVSYPDDDELRVTKVLTTPRNPADGVFAALDRADVELSEIAYFKHGTTTAINTILEGTGARTALITTSGFRDVLESARGNRPEAFDLAARRRPPLVPRDLRTEISARMDGKGGVIRDVDFEELHGILAVLERHEVEAVAVCLLHSYLNPAHELAVGDWLREHSDCYVALSHQLSREWREYERTSTTVLSAYVGPRLVNYLTDMERRLAEKNFGGAFLVMESNGGVITSDEAKRQPIFLLESGPVAGVVGTAELAERLGFEHVIAFDMGGTTAKCSLIDTGRIETGATYYVGGYERGYPVQVPVIDIIEVGAGGGSIASIDNVGQLRVGPRSAGAEPGPVCYGNGGSEPTVTDANLVLGRLGPHGLLAGGTLALDRGAAEEQIRKRVAEPLGLTVEDAALGIIRLAVVTMASAVRRVSIERGLDPRSSALVVTGGAGPLHGADIARELSIHRVIVPPVPGNFSGWGMLLTNIVYDVARIYPVLVADVSPAALDEVFLQMRAEAEGSLDKVAPYLRGRRFTHSADIRYAGQEHTVLVPLPASGTDDELKRQIGQDFRELYARRYGRGDLAGEIEIVSLRLSAEGLIDQPQLPATPELASAERTSPVDTPMLWKGQGWTNGKTYRRSGLRVGDRVNGPAVITEDGSTVVVGPRDSAEVDALGNLVIDVAPWSRQPDGSESVARVGGHE